MQQVQLTPHQQERQVRSDSLFMLVLSSTYVRTTCLNDLDPSFIPSLLCHHCCPFHYMVCSRTCLVLSPYALAVKVTCMQDCRRRISLACIGQELLPFQLSTVYLCTTWRLDPKAMALLPGFCIAVFPLLPVMKTWLFQGLT